MTLIQLRRGTAAQWTTADPVLASGEAGVETDTHKVKIGDGATTWAGLPYAVGGVGAQTVDGIAPDGSGNVDLTPVLAKYVPSNGTLGGVTRDSAGHVSAYTENGVTYTITRDSAGRVLTITDPTETKTVSRDSAGRVTGVA